MQSLDAWVGTVLLVPTYRWTPQIRANLVYLAALSGPDLGVTISDCSLDPEKHTLLGELGRRHPNVDVVIRSERQPLYQDVIALLSAIRSPRYVAICGDDDYVSRDYIVESARLLDRYDDAVCSYGNYLIWHQNSRVALDSRPALEATPRERLQKGFNPSYFNTMFFAVYRRTSLQPWVDFCTGHIMMAPFFDFLHCCSLLAQGKVRCHQRGFYLWSGENWDTPEENQRTRVRYYTQIGLPESFALFHDLHFAVEGVRFFLGLHSPVASHEERTACAQVVWTGCMNRFRQQVSAWQPAFAAALDQAPHAAAALGALLRQVTCDDERIVKWFCTIVSAFSPSIAERYRAQCRARP